MSNENPELDQNKIEQNNPNPIPNQEDAKARFQKMLERAKAKGEEFGKKVAEGRMISPSNQYVDRPGENYKSNADVKGLLEERESLGQAIERRMSKENPSEQDQEELQQLQARMSEIDSNPRVMESLSNEAERFKDNPEDMELSEWELQVKKSKEKAQGLAQELPALEAIFKNYQSQEGIRVQSKGYGKTLEVVIPNGDSQAVEQLQNFLNSCAEVIVPLKGPNDKTESTYLMSILITGGSADKYYYSPQKLFEEIRKGLTDAERVK